MIESTELYDFELSFYNDGSRYGLSEDWAEGRYEWIIEKEQSGSYRMYFNVMGDSTIVMRFSEIVEKDYVDGLAALIQDMKLPLLNGYYKKNSADKPGYTLFAMYETGEILSISAQGDAADTCAFEIQPLLDYAAKLNIKTIQ